MSTTDARGSATRDTNVGSVDMKLETVVIPVSDVDRAKTFYVVAENSGGELPT